MPSVDWIYLAVGQNLLPRRRSLWLRRREIWQMAQNPFEGNVGLCFRQNSYAVNLRNVVLDYAFWEKVGGGGEKDGRVVEDSALS